MLKNNEMILPKNFMAMNEDEMMYVDGGVNAYLAILGSAIYLVGVSSSTGYTRKIRKNGRLYSVTYNPSNSLKNFGQACRITGVSIATAGFKAIIGAGLGAAYSLGTTRWL